MPVLNAIQRNPRNNDYIKEDGFLSMFRTFERINTHYKAPEFPGYTPQDYHKIPEHNLLSAILSRALSDYVELRLDERKRKNNQDLWEDTCEWIHSDSYQPFSFVWILCHLFENPECLCVEIRQRVETMTNNDIGFRYSGRQRFTFSMRRKVKDPIQPE